MKTIHHLHESNQCVIVGNAWCPQSALIMQQKGFSMIGTTSWGIANLFGYKDGENIPYDLYFNHICNILKVIDIPLSVDLESGFSEDEDKIIENVLLLAREGVVGINIEDSTKSYELKTKKEFSSLLSKIRESLDFNGFLDFFINARIDTYIADVDNKLDKTISRAMDYEDSGANGIFVPLMNESSDIQSILSSISIPLNILSLENITDIDMLKSLGVRKVSFGNAMSDHMISEIERLSASIINYRNTSELYKHNKLTTNAYHGEGW